LIWVRVIALPSRKQPVFSIGATILAKRCLLLSMLFLPIGASAAEPGRTAASVPLDYAKNGRWAFSFGVGDVHSGLGVTAEFRYRHIGFFLSKATLPLVDVTGGVKLFQNPDASGLIVSVYGSYLARPASQGHWNSDSEVAFTLGMRHRFGFAKRSFFEWGFGYGYSWNTTWSEPDPEYPISTKRTSKGPGLYQTRLPSFALTFGFEL
jgi:hypothetical protein